jgi:hypothetical protein
VVAFAEGSDALAHEWSRRDSRYNPDETQKKLDERRGNQTGASLCKQFHEDCDAETRKHRDQTIRHL